VKSRTVFVGNIPYDASEDELRNIFSRVGAVESFRLVFDKDTKQPKGYGFCDYTDPDTALSAIRNLNEVEFSGRRLRIDLADNVLRAQQGLARLPGIGPGGTSSSSLPALPAPPTTTSPVPAVPLAPGMTPIRSSSSLWPLGAPPPPDPAALAQKLIDAAEVSAHTEIAQTVANMPKAQMQLCLGAMQRLAKEAPESARTMLQENPQLCYALLHAQLLLGLTLDPVMPPGEEELKQLKAHAPKRPMGLPCPVPAAAAPQVVPFTPGIARSVPGLLPGLVPLGAGTLRPMSPLGIRGSLQNPIPNIGSATVGTAAAAAASVGLAAKGAPSMPQ